MEQNLKKCPCGNIMLNEDEIRCSMCKFKLNSVLVQCGEMHLYIPTTQWEAWKKVFLDGK